MQLRPHWLGTRNAAFVWFDMPWRGASKEQSGEQVCELGPSSWWWQRLGKRIYKRKDRREREREDKL